MKAIAVVLLLAGCASTQGSWVQSGVSDAQFSRDRGFCIAQMGSVPGAGATQQAVVFAGCMQGKGWAYVEK